MQTRPEYAYSETKHASSYNALLFGIYDGTHENDGKGWSRIPLQLLSYRDLWRVRARVVIKYWITTDRDGAFKFYRNSITSNIVARWLRVVYWNFSWQILRHSRQGYATKRTIVNVTGTRTDWEPLLRAGWLPLPLPHLPPSPSLTSCWWEVHVTRCGLSSGQSIRT